MGCCIFMPQLLIIPANFRLIWAIGVVYVQSI